MSEQHPAARTAPTRVPKDLEPFTIGVNMFMGLSGLGLTKTYSLISSGVLKSVVVGRRRLIDFQSAKALLTSPLPRRGRPPLVKVAPLSAAAQEPPQKHKRGGPMKPRPTAPAPTSPSA